MTTLFKHASPKVSDLTERDASVLRYVNTAIMGMPHNNDWKRRFDKLCRQGYLRPVGRRYQITQAGIDALETYDFEQDAAQFRRSFEAFCKEKENPHEQ